MQTWMNILALLLAVATPLVVTRQLNHPIRRAARHCAEPRKK